MSIKTVVTITILWITQIQAQAQNRPPAPKLVEKAKYEKTLKQYTKWKENLSNPEFYEKFVWEGTDFKKRFPELTDFEKNQIYLIQGFKLEKELFSLKLAWDNELIYLKDETVTLPENAATAEEVEKFQKQLLKLHKATAIKFEKLIDNVFKKYKALIPIKEREFIKEQVVKLHDKFNLIERDNGS